MSSMTESGNHGATDVEHDDAGCTTCTPATIEVADGHVVHTCCGKLDDAEHRNFCEHYRAPDRSDDYREGYAEGYLSGLEQVRKYLAEDETGGCSVDTPGGDGGFAERFLEQMLERRGDCPEWCTLDHRGDDVRDDLILHQGDDHTDGSVRKLLDGTRLDIRLSRTDSLTEGTVGKPSLYVQCEVELTTWEQAGELARTILDGFGYLQGADQD
jgi:uncharacterized protein DUF6907